MDILELKSITDIRQISHQIFAKGWGEANGGNISIRLPARELAAVGGQLTAGKEHPLPFTLPGLAGDHFLVTGTGVFFRHIDQFPEESLGIIRINDRGDGWSLVWGYLGGGRPTSELSAHLLSHQVRKQVTAGSDTIVLHTHATNLIAISFVLPLNSAVLTRELWEMMSECLLLFPDGIGVLDWMLPGQKEIGNATAAMMARHRLILWAHHGLFGAGRSMDQLFGLIETADKAAEMLLKVLAAGGKRQAISASQLRELAAAFHVEPLAEALYEICE
ncbi:MAG: rhamnulose-1-phosphate aldolase [Desulfopila sp.]